MITWWPKTGLNKLETRKYRKHTHGSDCDGCNDRLDEVHVLLQSFFYQLKDVYEDAHISHGFRDIADQNAAFASGASKLQWPNSKHNKLPSEAIDIFQINENGKAVFDPRFCHEAYKLSIKLGFKFRWGGQFKTLGDFGHFELVMDS